MEPIIWKNRLCKVVDGMFWLSARGRHDDFDFDGGAEPDAAVAGTCGDAKDVPEGCHVTAAAVTGLEVIDADRLRVVTTDGAFVLHGDDFFGHTASPAYIAKE